MSVFECRPTMAPAAKQTESDCEETDHRLALLPRPTTVDVDGGQDDNDNLMVALSIIISGPLLLLLCLAGKATTGLGR